MAKKITALLLIILLVLTSMSGCSSKKSSKETHNNKTNRNAAEAANEKNTNEAKQIKQTEKQMGRYIEKDVDFPDLKNNEKIIKILQGTDDHIEIYTKAKYEYMCYRLKTDMSWESSKPSWLNDGTFHKNNLEIISMCYGQDDCYYLCYVDYGQDEKCHIIKADAKGENSQTVELPYLDEKRQMGNGEFYPTIRKIDVLQNGNLVLYDLINSNALLIFTSNGEKQDSVAFYDNGDVPSFIASKNDIISIAEDERSVNLYDTVNGTISKKIEYAVKQSNSAFISSTAYAVKEDGTIFIGDSRGIHRISPTGTLLETTVDGVLNSMSMPTLTFDELIVTEDEVEEYYAVFRDTNGSYKLKHYIFDKSVSSIPSTELSVYSLRENGNIRQSIALFQSKNPDVKINYVVAMGEEGGTVSDYIRALNTELLAGSGADILVLDGLPVASYIEKGVLADITGIIAPLEEAGILQPNITNSYKVDGKMYQMPLRFSMPFIIGNQDTLSSMTSMENIASYIEKLKGKPFSTPMPNGELIQNYLELYSKDFYDGEELSKEKLTVFLRNLKKVDENINLNVDPVSGRERNGFINLRSRFFFGMDDGAIQGNTIYNFFSTMEPLTAMKKDNLGCSSINKMFVPSGLIGLNSASKEADTAKQFINTLYSEELQNADLLDGFPVNITAMKKWVEKEDNSIFCRTDENGKMVTMTYPTREEREKIFKLIQELKLPIDINQVINDIIEKEALPFLKGDIDAEQAASAAYSKISTYMAE